MPSFLESLSSLDAARVRDSAAQIHNLNVQLETELGICKSAVDNLRESWKGTAAEDSISIFDGFINKYKEEYRAMIEGYVSYLGFNVADTGERVEAASIEASGYLS